MRCKNAQKDISLLLDDRLKENRRGELDAHLNECLVCTDFLKSMQTIRKWQSSEPSTYPEELDVPVPSALSKRLAHKREYQVHWWQQKWAVPVPAAVVAGFLLLCLSIGQLYLISKITFKPAPSLSSDINERRFDTIPEVMLLVFQEKNGEGQILGPFYRSIDFNLEQAKIEPMPRLADFGFKGDLLKKNVSISGRVTALCQVDEKGIVEKVLALSSDDQPNSREIAAMILQLLRTSRFNTAGFGAEARSKWLVVTIHFQKEVLDLFKVFANIFA